jgi:hypothetical protein
MLRGRLFVTPTWTNTAVVANLATFGRLKDIEVTWLPVDQKERWSELRRIVGRAAFMWGSGEKHNESYPFTSDGGVVIKAIIDRHRDRKPCSFPTDRTDSERERYNVYILKTI